MFKIGIDLGGTKIEGILLNEKLWECKRLRISTGQKDGYDAIIARIAGLYKELSSAIGRGEHTFGIGVPGSLSPNTGAIRFCNIQCMNGRPLADDLATIVGRCPAIANDANCFALAETRCGAAQGAATVFGMVLGTGCGGGVVINGEMMDGANKIAGEWGHTVLDPSGPPCYCGRRGCVERYLSGNALEDAYAKKSGDPISLPAILSRASEGEVTAQHVINGFLEAFGCATANLVSLLDPDVIVIGGGLSHIDAIYSVGASKVALNVMGGNLCTRIIRNGLGASSGVVGAALIGC